MTISNQGPIILKNLLTESDQLKILAVSFPNKKPFYMKNENGETETFYAATSEEETKELFRENNIPLIQGVMPFEEIIIPGVRDSNLKTVKETLSLISGGLQLCIQAILMATDSGYLDEGEKVVAMTADTSIVASGAFSQYLFHPKRGLEISEIISKPKGFTITRTSQKKKT